MLLELIATCVIGAGVVYTPPEGWTLDKVTFKGKIASTCDFPPGLGYGTCTAEYHPYYEANTITIRRAVQAGEKVTAPQGCEITSEAKASPAKENP